MTFVRDCSCISHTSVENISVEDHYDTVSHHYLTNEPAACSLSETPPNDDMTVYSTDISHYQLLSELGKGFHDLSVVCLARHRPTGNLVAVKRTNLDNCTEEQLGVLQNEVLQTQLFHHPNILTSQIVFTSSSKLWVISPLMAYGSAECLVKTYFSDGMSESLIAFILYGVLKGLDYLHRMGYIHRSVKASHILLSGDGRVYLSGLHSLYSMVRDGKRSKVVYDVPEQSSTVLPWLSPELLRQDLHGYDVKSDIYSLGITACELASGRVPFQDMHPTLMLLQKLKGSHCCLLDIHPFPLEGLGLKVSRSGVDSGIGESVATSSIMRTMTGERPQSPAPKNFSVLFHNFVELCLQHDPEKRPSARSLLTHAFLKQVKRHTKESFLNLLHPAVPLNNPRVLAKAAQTAAGQDSTTSPDGTAGAWEF
ncbi:STE20-related kinase adapter protein beta-like isoform X3 [Polyodon spathula]|uniref:STE20-related kinase adapter protein beta-like isoform X3 n=1 Tax=Polyodon spathula TaxID=7913 RepID=UPI001B7E3AC6|nr:STE20-related kinase adapter protein beta-like isoform X3 [Polyodon spathula]